MKKEIPKTKKEKKTVAANTASLPATSPQRPLKLFIKNILLLAGSIILLLMMKSYNNGYKWTYETLLRDNLIFMNEAKKMTDEEKMEYKLGFSWKYMNFIKENTPEDAIILMPPDTVFFPANEKSDFSKDIKSKAWASYFVYPRRLVYERERDSSLLYKQATHLAIVNYCGYYELPYDVKNKVKYSVLPLNKNISK